MFNEAKTKRMRKETIHDVTNDTTPKLHEPQIPKEMSNVQIYTGGPTGGMVLGEIGGLVDAR